MIDPVIRKMFQCFYVREKNILLSLQLHNVKSSSKRINQRLSKQRFHALERDQMDHLLLRNYCQLELSIIFHCHLHGYSSFRNTAMLRQPITNRNFDQLFSIIGTKGTERANDTKEKKNFYSRENLPRIIFNIGSIIDVDYSARFHNTRQRDLASACRSEEWQTKGGNFSTVKLGTIYLTWWRNRGRDANVKRKTKRGRGTVREEAKEDETWNRGKCS